MSAGAKTPLKIAQSVAEDLRGLLLRSCIQIEVAGSIRREKAEVGDGEIVAVPRIEGYTNFLHVRLDTLVAEGVIEKAIITDKNEKKSNRWGDKYRAIVYRGIKFDIFMTDTKSWGYQLLLRTGPAEANEYLVTRIKNSPAPFRVSAGDVWMGETRLAILTEEDMFALSGMPYMEPPKRSEQAYKTLLGRGHKWGKPGDFIPEPVKQIRLLWQYPSETLSAFPIPMEFRDEASGKIWANITTDRARGEYQLVEQGSIEAQFQHEFLVGSTQRNYELERLRKKLWWGEEIPVPGAMSLPALYLEPSKNNIIRVPLEMVVPTQATVYKWGVHIKGKTMERLQAGLFEVSWPAAQGLQFAGEERVFLCDGHHRYMAAKQYNQEYLSVDVRVLAMTYEQACTRDDDDTNYDLLADVMDEVYEILREKVLS